MSEDRKVVSLDAARAKKTAMKAPERVRYDLVASIDVGIINDELVALLINEKDGIGMTPEIAESLAARLVECAKIARKGRT